MAQHKAVELSLVPLSLTSGPGGTLQSVCLTGCSEHLPALSLTPPWTLEASSLSIPLLFFPAYILFYKETSQPPLTKVARAFLNLPIRRGIESDVSARMSGAHVTSPCSPARVPSATALAHRLRWLLAGWFCRPGHSALPFPPGHVFPRSGPDLPVSG